MSELAQYVLIVVFAAPDVARYYRQPSADHIYFHTEEACLAVRDKLRGDAVRYADCFPTGLGRK